MGFRRLAVRRVRRQPTWLATLRERPMRVSHRVVVGSPIQRSLAMGVALLLLAVIAAGTLVVGAQLLEPRTIVVGMLVGVVVTLVSALLPARRAATAARRPLPGRPFPAVRRPPADIS